MPPVDISRTLPTRWLNAGAHAAFLPIGIVTVLLGPLLPILSAGWSLNYSQAGALFTAQFLGSTIGVVISEVMVARWGSRFAISTGLLATAVGVGLLPVSSHFSGLICIACYGVGLGMAIPAVNLFVAGANPERRGSALSLLNFSWSVGAVACPFLVAGAIRANRTQLFLFLLAGFLLVVLLGIAFTPLSFAGSTPIEPRSARNQEGDSLKGRSLLVLGALFFLYVGAENGFGGWIASYAKSFGTHRQTLAVMTPSFFYSALMLGRWLAPLALKKVDEIKTAQIGLAVACAGMAGLLLSRTMPFAVASVSVAGLGLAAVYPITISRLSHEFGEAAARAGAIMFTLANIGGATLPWIVGYSANRFHDLRFGLAVPLVATALMYILYRCSFGWAVQP